MAVQAPARPTRNEPNCAHLWYTYRQQGGDPMHPGDNRPHEYVLAICDDCDEDITELVGDYDPEFDMVGVPMERGD